MKLYAYLAMFGGLAAFMIAGGTFMYLRGKADCEVRIIKETITVVEKRNEIANKRPDDRAFFNGLLNDADW